jgi:hypothetical protein
MTPKACHQDPCTDFQLLASLADGSERRSSGISFFQRTVTLLILCSILYLLSRVSPPITSHWSQIPGPLFHLGNAEELSAPGLLAMYLLQLSLSSAALFAQFCPLHCLLSTVPINSPQKSLPHSFLALMESCLKQ